jgi:hypothetical protein
VSTVFFTQNRFQTRAVLNTVIKFRVSETELKNLVIISRMIALEWYNKAGVTPTLMNVVKFPKRRTHFTVCLILFINTTVGCTSLTRQFRGTRSVAVV